LGEPDVLIVGGGPAGACAGLLLARAGARVTILDRATFPRDKLCGDTVNPGALARLRALGLASEVAAAGLRVDGMLLTGERGVAIEGRYPDGIAGCAILRRDLDWILLQHAAAAGCRVQEGVVVREAVVGDVFGGTRVTGVRIGSAARALSLSARIVIAADGRHSTVAFGLGLARHPNRPRRWAIGAYYENFARPVSDWCLTPVRHQSDTSPTPGPIGSLGEMHVRPGRYIGVAPVPGGLTNVCLVKASGPADRDLANPRALLTRELARDPVLRSRAAGARLVSAPVVLGPLAVDAVPAAIAGLLVAGDAAGFIDPMTGDGLRFAIRGAELTAAAALDALAHGWTGVHARLAETRAREFGGKWRFNRALRALVASPRAVDAATLGARVAPAVFRALIAHAGDCHAAC